MTKQTLENKDVQEIKTAVLHVLNHDKGSRNNDIRLIKLVLKRLHFPADLEALEKYPSNIFETIRRCRQKIQEQNPFLQPTKKTRNNRQKKREAIEKWLKEEL